MLQAKGSVMTAIPPQGWLPVGVDGRFVDWVHFGEQRLEEPFFEGSVRRALQGRPADARRRTTAEALVAANPARAPDGFIFHMSRCGSTLVSQMLAGDPECLVISEAAIIEQVVDGWRCAAEDDAEAQVRLLRAVIGALGRHGDPKHVVVKLDSWHVLAWPLFRRAFPSTPWVFVYREPAEVLASQIVERGMHTVPDLLPPSVFGLRDADTMPAADYCARILGKVCESAVALHAQGGGLLVNYRELPDAVGGRIAPHFGLPRGARMTERAAFDAKTPGLVFSGVEAPKRDVLTDALRATAERHAGDAYRTLERPAGRPSQLPDPHQLTGARGGQDGDVRERPLAH